MTEKISPELQRAATSLDALGHHARLAIFRLLVRAGSEGMNVGDVIQNLGIAPSTLSYHLKTLVDADLVVQERHGRQIVNCVNFDAMNQTVAFLTSECCSGVRATRSNVA
jgi:DNA-binding transcriptional ArsR family regulator